MQFYGCFYDYVYDKHNHLISNKNDVNSTFTVGQSLSNVFDQSSFTSRIQSTFKLFLRINTSFVLNYPTYFIGRPKV